MHEAELALGGQTPDAMAGMLTLVNTPPPPPPPPIINPGSDGTVALEPTGHRLLVLFVRIMHLVYGSIKCVRAPATTLMHTSDKNILYVRRLVVYRNQRGWWCKKQGNKASD